MKKRISDPDTLSSSVHAKASRALVGVGNRRRCQVYRAFIVIINNVIAFGCAGFATIALLRFRCPNGTNAVAGGDAGEQDDNEGNKEGSGSGETVHGWFMLVGIG